MTMLSSMAIDLIYCVCFTFSQISTLTFLVSPHLPFHYSILQRQAELGKVLDSGLGRRPVLGEEKGPGVHRLSLGSEGYLQAPWGEGSRQSPGGQGSTRWRRRGRKRKGGLKRQGCLGRAANWVGCCGILKSPRRRHFPPSPIPGT